MTKVWEQVQVNMIGPFSLLAEDKYRYVLTVLDSYSRHVQVLIKMTYILVKFVNIFFF